MKGESLYWLDGSAASSPDSSLYTSQFGLEEEEAERLKLDIEKLRKENDALPSKRQLEQRLAQLRQDITQLRQDLQSMTNIADCDHKREE